jgi:hypothetical protein
MLKRRVGGAAAAVPKSESERGAEEMEVMEGIAAFLSGDLHFHSTGWLHRTSINHTWHMIDRSKQARNRHIQQCEG